MDGLDYFDWLEIASRAFDLRLITAAEYNLAVQPRFGTGWKTSNEQNVIQDARDAYGIQDLQLTDCGSCFGEGRHKNCGFGPEAMGDISGYEPCHDENGRCLECNGRGFYAMIPWDKVLEKVRTTIKPKPPWARDSEDPRGHEAKVATPDDCSACGGTGDCPRCGGNLYLKDDDNFLMDGTVGPAVPCDLCRGRNHCAYCGRAPEVCHNCGNNLIQSDDGTVRHREDWAGFEPNLRNLRDPVDPRGPKMGDACNNPQTTSCPDCKGYGCESCNDTGWRDGVESRVV